MIQFYVTRDGTRMMAFIVDCHPELAEIRRLSPGVAGMGTAAP